MSNPTFDILMTPDSFNPITQRGGVAQLLSHFNGRSTPGVTRPHAPFRQVSPVYACVKARVDAIGSLPLRVSTAEDQIVESGPVPKLIERPNPKMSARAFWRATEAFLLLAGRVHWVMTIAPGGLPVEVYPVSPLFMEPIVNRGNGELTGWKMRRPGQPITESVTLTLDEVCTVVDPNFDDPANEYDGMSPLKAAYAAVSQFYKADLANEASLDNGVEPGGALTTPGLLGDTQRRVLREEIADRHQGVNSRKRFMLLEGGMTWERMAASFNEMEFSLLKTMSRTDICAVFNVPPAVIGYYEDSNYAHAEAAEIGFWTKTVLTRAAWLSEEWTLGVASRFNADRSLKAVEAKTRRMDVRDIRSAAGAFRRARDAARRNDVKYYAWFDASAVPAVQKAMLALADQVVKLTSAGVPLNELIRTFDLPFPDLPWGDTWYKPIGLMDVREDTTPGGHDPTLDPATPADPASPDAPKGVQGRPTAKDGPKGTEPLGKATEATLHRLWLAWRASWTPIEGQVAWRFRKHFAEMRANALKRLAEAMPQISGKAVTPDVQRDVIGQVLIGLEPSGEQIVAKVSKLIRESYRLGGEQVMREAADAQGKDKADPFNIQDPEIDRVLRKRLIKIAEPDRTVRRRVAEQLAEGVRNQETQDQLAERIREEFGFASERARTIARTEVGAAVEEARAIGRSQAGALLKSWLWSRKEKGRRLHQGTEAETMANPIPDSQDFTIAGTSITCPYPRATGVPEHDINCGCTAISRYPGDSLKSVLDRYTRRGFLTYQQLVERDSTAGADVKHE